jgi:hypothetical protein
MEVDYAIVSENYWPAVQQDTMLYHPVVAQGIEAFQKEYAVLKKPRKVHPAALLGQVPVSNYKWLPMRLLPPLV